MKPKLSVVNVAGVVLEKEDGSVLLVQRPLNKDMGGLWEIPGGKIEPFETPEEATIRELKEEVGIDADIQNLRPLLFVSHAYEHFHLVLLVFLCKKWQGEPKLLEGQEDFQWVFPQNLYDFLVPDADKPLIDLLQRRAKEKAV